MKKYYIEISDTNNSGEYIMQSEWFDTEEKAIEWWNNIKFLDIHYDVYLMASEWNLEEDTYTDIECIRCISNVFGG